MRPAAHLTAGLDMVADFTHPSLDGVTKVADQLLAFFKTDPLATPWFLSANTVGHHQRFGR